MRLQSLGIIFIRILLGWKKYLLIYLNYLIDISILS